MATVFSQRARRHSAWRRVLVLVGGLALGLAGSASSAAPAGKPAKTAKTVKVAKFSKSHAAKKAPGAKALGKHKLHGGPGHHHAGAAQEPQAPQLWSFVDAKGRAHLADEQVDARYQVLLHEESAEPWRVPRPIPSSTLAWMDSAPEVSALQPVLSQAQAATGVDADLLKAIIMVESRFQPHLTSRDGATGLMQINPRTGNTYALPSERGSTPAVQRLKNPEHNVMVGARLLADLFKRLGRVDVALAAWNAGEGKVRSAGGQVPAHAGVRNHIRRVLEIYWGLLQRRQAAASSGSVAAAAEPARLELLAPPPDATALAPAAQ
jgi:soluble lytic murein transglycosylase-like protein